MAINTASLRLRTGNVSFSFPGSNISASLGWEVYHQGLGDVLESGIVGPITVAKVGALDEKAQELYVLAQSVYASVLAKHEAIEAIGGMSAHDADLILDRWWFNIDDGTYTITHPINGSFAGQSVDPKSFVACVNEILSLVPPAPVWFWADSPAAGQLHVKCVQVAGADSYSVYNRDTLLDSGLTKEETLTGLSAGTYVVRMGAVDGGQLGILSFPITVEVA